jgi:hypothetical protein
LCGMARLSYVALFRYGQAHVDFIGVVVGVAFDDEC